ncbi:MAG: ABC transporter ATP-binding protein [Pirellula sp.]|jgi:putative ABC transport system ATP-binding protein
MSVNCRDIKMAFKTAAGSVDVLKGIDFSAPAGMLTMLVGPSGCGKTTLISLIAGLLRGASGSMHVFGHDVSSMSASMLVSYRLKNIGFIFQQYNLLAGLTAAENVAVPLVASGFDWPIALSRGKELLDTLGLGAHATKLPSQLSGGQQQRVAIARALVHSPKLLLCDEPTAALDGQAGKAVMTLLRTLAVVEDRAAIVVTHDPRVYSFADRVVHMEDGLISKVETLSVQKHPIDPH